MKIRFLLILLFVVSFNLLAKAKETTIPIDDLFRSPDTFSFKLNPSSKYIAKHFFRGEDYNVIEIHDVDSGRVSDAFRLKVKEYATIREFYWIDEDTLYIDYIKGKNKERQIFLDIDFDVFNSSDEEIATIHRIKSSFDIIDPLLSQDNKVLVQVIKNEKIQVYKSSIDAIVSDNYKDEDRFTRVLDDSLSYFTGDNERVQFAISLDDDELIFWYLKDYKSDWVKLFSSTDSKFEFEPVAVIDEHTMIGISNKEWDKKVLVEFNYKTNTFGEVLYQHEKYDLISASVSSKTGLPISVSYYDHGQLNTEYFYDSHKNFGKKIKQHFPNKQYVVHSRQRDPNISIIFVFSSDDPGHFFWFNAEENRFIPLGAYKTFLEKYQFSTSKNFTVKSEENVEIEAFLTEPNNGNGVLLVVPHGGPVGVRDIDGFSSSNQFYASRGYSILNVNFRGSKGYGKSFKDSGVGQFGKIIEKDITAAVNKVRKDYRYTKVCSMGASYGGYSALTLAMNKKEYDCAIAAYGVYDLPLLFNTSNIQMSERNIKSVSMTVGDYDDSLKDYSPLYLAEKINVPVLLIAGKKDKVSGFEQSNRMKYRLKQLNKDVETIFYKQAGHGHESRKWEKHEHLIIDEFLRRKLALQQVDGLSNEAKGKEAMRIADGYEFDGQLDYDGEKALEFYSLAANFNSPRGLYNLAAIYQRGSSVEKSIEKSIELYKKSSKLDYEGASFRLGIFYRNGKIVNKDYDKSLSYFELAKKQGHDKAELEISRLACFNLSNKGSLDDCIAYIEDNVKSDRDNVLMLVRDVLFDETFDKSYLAAMIAVLDKSGFADAGEVIQFEVVDSGMFKYRRNWDSYRLESDDFDLEINKYKKFGIYYKTVGDGEDYSKYLLFKVIWHHPPFKDDDSEKPKLIEQHLRWASLDNKFNLLYSFNENNSVDGLWGIEIQKLDGTVLFKKEFNLTFAKEE